MKDNNKSQKLSTKQTKSNILRILLSSKIKGGNVSDLSDLIIEKFGNKLFNLTIKDLNTIKGIGNVKAQQILNIIKSLKERNNFTYEQNEMINNTCQISDKRGEYTLFDFFNVDIPVEKLHINQKKDKLDKPSYISLFSGAGVGCYGFKEAGFNCISTVELLEKRLKIQKYNDKCLFESGYICGDIRDQQVKDKLKKNIEVYLKEFKKKDIDVLIATPPCQGMSVANHKKNNELGRNSLVIESLKLTNEIMPKIFIYENVSAFLNTVCTDVDGQEKKIIEAINENLLGDYNIYSKIINFKNYGSNSSRTRTLVIGVRKNLKDITPFDIFPNYQNDKTLFDIIGDLPALNKMGEISKSDIFHQFKKYTPSMRSWIEYIKEGESAFENQDKNRIPHRIVDGEIIYNQNKNGDKYKRQIYNKVAPCIHTRNDILSSQNTVHPIDDRVFSIREVMRMMTIPQAFLWSQTSNQNLNNLSNLEKELFLKKEEMNIRHSIGEAVPTNIFKQIAEKIKNKLKVDKFSQKDILLLIENNKLQSFLNLKKYIQDNPQGLDYNTLLKIAEYSNAKRNENAAFYTTQDIVYSTIKQLPKFKKIKELYILEPSVGIGAFLPQLIKKYADIPKVNIDVVDIDNDSLEILMILIEKLNIPENIKINIINADFIKYKFSRKYDIVIGNPPFGKIPKQKKDLQYYLQFASNKKTNNIFSFFIEKCLQLGTNISLIVPKSLLSSPEFNKTRLILSEFVFNTIIDYGEQGFKGVKIETISFNLNTKERRKMGHQCKIESFITNEITLKNQSYIFDCNFPYWLIYRNDFFDEISNKLIFNLFSAFRDRQITKKHTNGVGRIRVLKSKNIASNKILNKKDYDCFIDDISPFSVKRFFNKKNLILVPNLTYNPRACFLPENTITDGSVAILSCKNDKYKITEKDLEYFNTKDFSEFYSIARNKGTRSLNIDNNSVFYFGKLKENV